MFQVIHVDSKKPRTVYAVEMDEKGDTWFLFYDKNAPNRFNKWYWENSVLYDLYEEKEDNVRL